VRDWIARLPREKSPLTTVRAFQDGPYVFTQTEGDLLGQNVLFDVFKLENGLIVEHWVFSTQAAPPNQSGHTQTDGPTQAKPDENTEKSKSIVREYYETVHISGDHGKISQYSSEEPFRSRAPIFVTKSVIRATGRTEPTMQMISRPIP
jgi:hypothetical protein